MRGAVVAVILQITAWVHGRPTAEDIHKVFYMDFKPLSTEGRRIPSDCPYNLCNHTKPYDEKALREIVAKNDQYRPLFGNVLEMNRTVSIESRFGEPEKMNMCRTKSVTMFPKQGITVNQQLKNIVNVRGYHQMVSFETCDDGAECYATEEYLPIGVKSLCETQYIVIRLVVINDDDTLGLERFSIPAGCSCMYLQGNTFSFR